MCWVAAGAGYHYGHLKNLSYVTFLVAVLLASGIANIYHGEFKLWSEASTRRLEARLAPFEPTLSRLAVTVLVVLSLAFVYNTYLSVWWNWQGVGWNAERRIAPRRPAPSPTGCRPAAACSLDPISRIRCLRVEYRSWSTRLASTSVSTSALPGPGAPRSVWSGVLTGREIVGFASTPAFFTYQQLDDESQDFVILNGADDPRTHGLQASDAVFSTPYWTVYQVADGRRLTANDIGRARGSLDISPGAPVRLGIREGRLATGRNLQPAAQTISFGVLATGQDVILVNQSEVVVDPGLTWITAPAAGGSVLSVSAHETSGTPQIVAAWLTRDRRQDSVRVEHVPRHVISVDVDARDGVIAGTVSAVNPTGAGQSAGFTYRESSASGAVPSHGFWESAARVSTPAQRIEVRYDLRDRTLLEEIDGKAFPPATARAANLHGAYRLILHVARGFISDFEYALIEYRTRSGELQTVQPYRQVYAFDMLDKPVPRQP